MRDDEVNAGSVGDCFHRRQGERLNEFVQECLRSWATKQFCGFGDQRTMLEYAMRRAVLVLTAHHGNMGGMSGTRHAALGGLLLHDPSGVGTPWKRQVVEDVY